MYKELTLIKRLERRLERLEGRPVGPSIGSVYATFLALPWLRAFWPFSSLDEGASVHDLSDQGRTLTISASGVSDTLYNNLISNYAFNGTTGYLYRASEAGLNIGAALTIGGWFKLDSLAAGHNQGMIGKWNDNGVNKRQYLLYLEDTNNNYTFEISTDGTATKATAITAVDVNLWHFVVGRFTPSAEVAVFRNGTKLTNTTTIPATLFSSDAQFNIAAYDAGVAGFMDGNTCLCFVCAAALHDDWIKHLFEVSRGLFGA